MRTRKWLVMVVSGLAGATGCGVTPSRSGPGRGPDGQAAACADPDTLARCARLHDDWTPPRTVRRVPRPKYGILSPHEASAAPPPAEGQSGDGDSGLLSSDCPTLGGCGVNGAWLGSGVQFRTLHLTAGTPNEQGLQIKEFRRWDPVLRKYEILRIDVQGQELLGYRPLGGILTGTDLIGAELLIEHVTPLGEVDGNYTLRIEPTPPSPEPARAPDYHRFWATCAGGHCPEAPRLYTFSVTSSDGCEIRLCKPGLADDYAGGLKGTAVIFRGDLYHDNYTAELEQPDRYDSDLFNIACIGTSISKLHMLRHTTAAENPDHHVTAEHRTAMLKLLAADYCGTGYPMTEDGLPLKLAFNDPAYPLTDASGYIFSQPDRETIDAAWTAQGASCIGTSRLHRIKDRNPDLSALGDDELRDQIIKKCTALRAKTSLVATPIQACGSVMPTAVTPSTPFAMDNYAASGNPASSP